MLDTNVTEILKKVQRIQIVANRTVNDLLAGQYKSIFRGRGMEFDEVREYQPGDDVRTIDWNVTARTGTAFIKRYCEERELTVMLLADVSASGAFGSARQSKLDLLVEMAALLMFSALKNNDKVGLITFCHEVLDYFPPRKGKANVLRLIRQLVSVEPVARETNFQAPLDFLNQVQRRRAVVFLLSDFLVPAENSTSPPPASLLDRDGPQAPQAAGGRRPLGLSRPGRPPRFGGHASAARPDRGDGRRSARTGHARRGVPRAARRRDGRDRRGRHASSAGAGVVRKPFGRPLRAAFRWIEETRRRSIGHPHRRGLPDQPAAVLPHARTEIPLMEGRATLTCLVLLAAAVALLGGCGRTSTEPSGDDEAAQRHSRSQVERGPVRVIAEVQPAKARLSDEPKLTLRIEYEPGVKIDKPPFGESLGGFLIRDFREPLPKVHDQREIIEQVYTLEPMETGRLSIDPISVTFTDNRPEGDGKRHTVETEALSVEIESVVAAAVPSLGELRPSAGPVALPYHGLWAFWLAGGSVLALAAGAALIWYRARRRKAIAAVVLSPEQVATMELDRLMESRLAERDVKSFFVALTGIVRRYIEQVTAIRAPEQTTEEFLREIGRMHTFNAEESLRLRSFLESADLVKFAAHQPRHEDIDESAQRARLFIGSVQPPSTHDSPLPLGERPGVRAR